MTQHKTIGPIGYIKQSVLFQSQSPIHRIVRLGDRFGPFFPLVQASLTLKLYQMPYHISRNKTNKGNQLPSRLNAILRTKNAMIGQVPYLESRTLHVKFPGCFSNTAPRLDAIIEGPLQIRPVHLENSLSNICPRHLARQNGGQAKIWKKKMLLELVK